MFNCSLVSYRDDSFCFSRARITWANVLMHSFTYYELSAVTKTFEDLIVPDKDNWLHLYQSVLRVIRMTG